MPRLPITVYPAPVLFQVGQPITSFDGELRELVSNMFITMYAAPGVGLAAQQVGLAKQLFVMDCAQNDEPRRPICIANPVIVSTEGEQNDHEGCLSVPGYTYKLKRPMRVVVRGQNEFGSNVEYSVSGLEARCVLHETDHCNGVLYIRRLSLVKREDLLGRINKKVKAGAWPGTVRSHSSADTEIL